MRGMVLIVLLASLGLESQAQKWKEWFKQRKTQIEYLVNQIGALQIYIEYARKGYEIADKGLQLIGDIKDGDLQLHQVFFEDLKAVNPYIRSSSEVAAIITLQIRIIEARTAFIRQFRASGQLNVNDLSYVERVLNKVVDQAADNVQELSRLITDHRYELSDDERLHRIETLHTDMLDKYKFVQWFGDQTMKLSVQQLRERNEARISKLMYGIKE